nr:immunoglobulin light chain junction region [Macaca mulatta]
EYYCWLHYSGYWVF